MQRVLLLTLCVLSLGGAIRSQDIGPVRGVFQPGEMLRYRVRWTFFRLGTLTLRADRDTSSADGSDVRLIMQVESNPDLPFLRIQEYNESHVDSKAICTRHFLARHQNGNDLLEIRQQYDQRTQTARASEADLNTDSVIVSNTIEHAPCFVDGPALLFKARALSRSTGTVRVATMTRGKIENTTLEFGGDTEDLEIGAWGKEIRTRKYYGHADWTGGTSVGLGGGFTGWVSDDDAAVPIRAELKILLGSIVLELEEWTRPGWVPPSSAEMAAERVR
jgi:hypothetical protein